MRTHTGCAKVLQGLGLVVIESAILGGTLPFGALIPATHTNGFNILNLGATYQSFVIVLGIIAAAAAYTATGLRGGRPRAGEGGRPVRQA